MPSSLSVIIPLLSFLFLCLCRRRWTRASSPLPPGPKGLPLVGNLFQLPRQFEHEAYREWSREYGSDVIYLNILGLSIVVLDKYETAIDLFEKRSGIYSGRPDVPMIRLIGWKMMLAILPYGDTWRRHRKLFVNVISEKTNARFCPKIEKAVHRLLNDLLDAPNEVNEHIQLMTGSTMSDIAYGLKVDSNKDQLLVDFEKVNYAGVQAGLPGSWLVNVFPILEHLPTWAPGAYFKRWAAERERESKSVIEGAYCLSKKRIDDGTATTSFISQSLQEAAMNGPITDEDRMMVAMSMYSAGTETTSSVISTFILAMLIHPDVQKKAQEEIDKACNGHLPTLQDVQEDLPYVMAVVLEVMRWSAPAPSGVPHYLETDDIYNGYYIPGGSIVIPNIWGMLHDDQLYPDPNSFRPERFLKDGKINPEIRDPRNVVFGFGRRICPGRFLASTTVQMAVANILAMFDITKSEETVLPEAPRYWIPSLVFHPVEFKCSIKPRSMRAEQLIRSLKMQED